MLLISLSSVSAANQTINSTSTGGISQGITNTGYGDTLFLQPGTYNKINQDTNITINKNITIQGNGSKNNVIIDAQRLSGMFTIANNIKVTFINITFINGYTSSNGGVISNPYSSTSINIMNCTLANNTARDGGAVYNYGNNGIISNNDFINNTANINGGAIHNYGANIIINNNNFTNNTAISNDGGGAIHNYGTNIIINNNNFTNNNASLTAGGAIMTAGISSIITNNNFVNNTSLNNGAGAIFVGVFAINTIISNNNFTDNKGLSGGALVISGTQNCSIINNNFINNTATTNGGAIFNRGNNTSVSNNVLIGNKAGNLGGAIFNNINGNMSVSNNSMSNNSATLGQMIYNDGAMGVLNLTFIDNSTWLVKNGSTITLYTHLLDDMGNTVTGQNISFYINGIFFANMTSIEGYANITYTVHSNTIYIPISGKYAGNGAYNILINDGLLRVKIPTIITVSVPDNLTVGETVTIESRLTDKDGNILPGANVDFYVDGKKIGSAITDQYGIARINHTFNNVGKPIVEAKYLGNDTYFASNATNRTTVRDKIIPPEPTPNPNPQKNNNSSYNPIPNPSPNTNDTTNITKNNLNTANAATMKNTGIPIFLILIVLLSSLGLIAKKK